MSESEVTRDQPEVASDADRVRLSQMFAEHHVTVWRSLRRRGFSPEAAADATQETFMIAFGRLADIDRNSERAFLLGTARRVVLTQRRQTKRWQLDEDLDRRIANVRDASDERADVQLCDLALAKLNPELAETFVLYEIEGLSSPEIAALLEVPLGSVASRLRRAREQFREVVTRLERGLLKMRGRS